MAALRRARPVARLGYITRWWQVANHPFRPWFDIAPARCLICGKHRRQHARFEDGKIIDVTGRYILCGDHGVQRLVVADQDCGGMECQVCLRVQSGGFDCPYCTDTYHNLRQHKRRCADRPAWRQRIRQYMKGSAEGRPE